MVCEHLGSLELAITAAGIDETYRGQPWSQNCREWVYFDCLLDVAFSIDGECAVARAVVKRDTDYWVYQNGLFPV